MFYDPTQLSASQLTQKAEQLGTTLLYQYKNFNAIAVYVNNSYSLEKMINKLEQINGVVGINRDKVMQLK